MNTQSHYVFFIRWCIYGLAGGFCIYEIFLGSWNGFGGPFRYLTIWALFLSFYSSNRMLALSRSRTIRSHQITAICASVLNVMVVYLYWKLYFTDPSLVNSDGPSVWYREYYLHGLGPASSDNRCCFYRTNTPSCLASNITSFDDYYCLCYLGRVVRTKI